MKKIQTIFWNLKIYSNFALQSTFYMQKEQDYLKDIIEIRAMMERSSKFLSISGWSGIMAGLYALIGSYIGYAFLKFNPKEVFIAESENMAHTITNLIILASVILILSIGTAIFLSYTRATKRGEKIWNATSRRLLTSMAFPLVVGGILILILITKDLIGLLIPLTLVFYGLALYGAGNFTFREIKFLGLIQVVLGLIAACCIEWSLILWAIGFGLMHILYGIYIHLKYER